MSQEVELLGFHFSSDIARLRGLCTADYGKVIDLQREAMRRSFKGGQMPGGQAMWG